MRQNISESKNPKEKVVPHRTSDTTRPSETSSRKQDTNTPKEGGENIARRKVPSAPKTVKHAAMKSVGFHCTTATTAKDPVGNHISPIEIKEEPSS